MTVQRLINDFESNEDLGNKTVEFKAGKKESKHSSLKRLMTMLNEESDIKASKNSSKKQKQMLTDGKYKLEDLRSHFKDLVGEDRELSSIFGENSPSNPLVNEFRQELLDELLKLVEIALLEQQTEKSSALKQDILVKRLNDL